MSQVDAVIVADAKNVLRNSPEVGRMVAHRYGELRVIFQNMPFRALQCREFPSLDVHLDEADWLADRFVDRSHVDDERATSAERIGISNDFSDKLALYSPYSERSTARSLARDPPRSDDASAASARITIHPPRFGALTRSRAKHARRFCRGTVVLLSAQAA